MHGSLQKLLCSVEAGFIYRKSRPASNMYYVEIEETATNNVKLTIIVFVIIVLIVESMHFCSFHRWRWWGTVLFFYTGKSVGL